MHLYVVFSFENNRIRTLPVNIYLYWSNMKIGGMVIVSITKFSHIGITVPDIQKAITFYTSVFGWEVIKEAKEIIENGNKTMRLTEVFGAGWGSFKVAHLLTSDKIGIELFEFPAETHSKGTFEYKKTGLFHFCVQSSNPEGLMEKIIENGGKQRMPIREHYPNEKPYRMVFCEDPFGVVFEIYSHDYDEINS